MSLFTVFVLSVSLAMDAFAVSISKGLSLQSITWKEMAKAGLWFGIFQGLMPAIGYFLGDLFVGYFEAISGWIGFGILAFIGIGMIREGLKKEDDDSKDAGSMSASIMLLLAIATSIDALAVGVAFSAIPVEIVSSWNQTANTMLACLMICVVTAVISAAGIKIGELFGARFKSKAQIAGGVLLILIGISLLLPH